MLKLTDLDIIYLDSVTYPNKVKEDESETLSAIVKELIDFSNDPWIKKRIERMHEKMFDEKFVKRMKEQYPAGTRIRLISMEDNFSPVPPGTEGTVVYVDDAGTLGMKWDNGRTLGICPEVDRFVVI